jgi:hypothetical protein
MYQVPFLFKRLRSKQVSRSEERVDAFGLERIYFWYLPICKRFLQHCYYS